MDSIVITPRSKEQIEKIKKFVQEMGLSFGVLSSEDREDAALLKAMKEGDKDKREISLDTFLKNLKS
ncbi:hypothetical protein [Niabella ginsengisoli]|uniref:Uncharacterized protein n=1 Tax=Niabella ginsengisoli TaxID=522298 RepID=A0ABS9SKA7_9BACT|nr:hypothetical protein [Niabella ginsengisoli]MCH5598808.1 hypothetical protein [Niabella ginsengisoli]